MNRETAFAHFMVNAPEEIPSWFAGPPEHRPAYPCEDIEDPHILQKIVDGWRKDPCYDLADEHKDEVTPHQLEALAVYEETWKKYWKELSQSIVDQERARYFAWRVHYAIQMVDRYLEFTEAAPEVEERLDALRKNIQREHEGEFIVISYDQDQQQTFFDSVKADCKEDAITIAGMLRGQYAFLCDAITIQDVHHFLNLFNLEGPWLTVDNIKEEIENNCQEWPYEDHVKPSDLLGSKLPLEYECHNPNCDTQTWSCAMSATCCPKCQSADIVLIRPPLVGDPRPCIGDKCRMGTGKCEHYVHTEMGGMCDYPEDEIPEIEPPDESDHVCSTCNDPDCNRPEGHALDEHDKGE